MRPSNTISNRQAPAIDEKTKAIIENVYSGNLANSIKNNAKYALTGFAIGAVAGFVFAAFTGKSRLLWGSIGAIGGGSIGYIVAPEEKTILKT